MTPGRYIAIGLALATALAGLWLMLSGRTVARLDGGILQVRSVATDTRAQVVILDVRVSNPGRALFMVKSVSVLIEDAEGTLLEAEAAAEPDIDRLLDYHKLLGPRYNPTLKSRQRIEPGQTSDYTIAGAFLLTEAELAQRRSLRVRIVDVDGAQADLGMQKR
ncbi:MAG: hypothetical protein KJZ84_15050 [Bryobacteraceae bacterium]|nr:hypothetical protein [Bryobacteraceae bacterium]